MAATVVRNSVIANLTLLNHVNYEDWSFRVKTYLLAEDLWDVIEATNEPPKREDGEAEFKAWRKNDAKALYAIQSSCGDGTYPLIRSVTTSKDAWDILATVVPNVVIDDREVLNCDNYEYWSFRVKTYLLAEDLWDVVEATNEPPEREAEYKAWRKNDAKALYIIQSSCWGATYSFISSATTSEDAWNILAENFKPDWRPVVEVSSDDYISDEVEVEEGRAEGSRESFASLVENANWEKVMAHLDEYPDAVRSARFLDGGTALHMAILSGKLTWQERSSIARKLVSIMTADDLEVRDAHGWQAIYYIIKFHPEAVELVKRVCAKNTNIFGSNDVTKLVVLAQSSEFGEETACFLYMRMPTNSSTLSVASAAQLISDGLKFKRFDIAWDLIQRYPYLALAKTHNGNSPLVQLAGMHSAFLGGSQLKFWEQWIYDGIHINPASTLNGINPQKLEIDQINQKNLISSDFSNPNFNSTWDPCVRQRHPTIGLSTRPIRRTRSKALSTNHR